MLTLFFFNEVTTIIALTEGGPIHSTTTLSYYILKKGFEEYAIGYGNALSTILFLISFSVIVLWITLLRKKEYEI
jgi:ABC-type sugar transport system permease subunit